MGIIDYLEIIGGLIAIIVFISPIIFFIIKAKIMGSVNKLIKSAVSSSETEMMNEMLLINKNTTKDIKVDIEKKDEKIISMFSETIDKKIQKFEDNNEEKRQLRSETYAEKIDNLKTMVSRNEEQRKHETEVIFEVLDSIKNEINSLSKLNTNHEVRLITQEKKK